MRAKRARVSGIYIYIYRSEKDTKCPRSAHVCLVYIYKDTKCGRSARMCLVYIYKDTKCARSAHVCLVYIYIYVADG